MSMCLDKQLESTLKFFRTSTSVFEEADSSFVPKEGMFSVAQQVEHTAQTVDWFVDGAFGGSGWDMDFAKHDAATRNVTSLAAAREHLEKAFARAAKEFGGRGEAELNATLPANDPIMPGAPKSSLVGAIADHTAHHRGALTVYARLLGKTPPMPYM